MTASNTEDRAKHIEQMSQFQAKILDQPRHASLIFVSIDIDGFWGLGIRQGEALTQLEDHLKRAFPGCHLAQIGNDHFGLLILDTHRFPLETAFRLLDQVRVSLQASVNATFSAGIAAYPKDTNESSEVVVLSSEALYKAKQAGRNQVALVPAEKMKLKTSHYRVGQLERLARLSEHLHRSEATLLREALEYFLQRNGID